MTVTKKTAEKQADLEEIVPVEKTITVIGRTCRVRRLKTLEFIALIRVLTSGLGSTLSTVSIDFSNDETVAQDLSALMLLALPNATEEFALLLRQMVEPVEQADKAVVAEYLLDNPDLDVLIDVFEAIATQEKDDLSMLAGKLQAAWSRVVPLYSRQTTKK